MDCRVKPGNDHRCCAGVSGLLDLAETVVERVAGAADGADRIDLPAGIQQLSQAADVYVDGALIDVDVAAPDAVEQE
jgi:hypothetical protein